MNIAAILVLLISLAGCEKGTTKGMDKNDSLQTNATKPDTLGTPLSYLALGDSYTIGEAVATELNFPYQLAARLTAAGLTTGTPKIIAKTGWTTDELQSGIKEASLTGTYDFVTLLIGVNNQYRGNAIETYRTEFRALLESAIAFANGNTAHVFVVSIPDWGATPYGKQSGRGQENIGREVDAFNVVNKEEALKLKVSYTDITPGSKNANRDESLVASDGLHPSGKMYSEWAAQVLPEVVKAFKK